MPRTKTTRSSFGSVIPTKIKRDGRTVLVYDARKRYRNEKGERKQKFKRCDTHSEAMRRSDRPESERVRVST